VAIFSTQLAGGSYFVGDGLIIRWRVPTIVVNTASIIVVGSGVVSENACARVTGLVL
jgi:hypothetical protein